MKYKVITVLLCIALCVASGILALQIQELSVSVPYHMSTQTPTATATGTPTPTPTPYSILPPKYRHMVQEINKETRIPEAIIFAWVQRESEWNPTARGTKGERGLTQVMPTNIREFRWRYYNNRPVNLYDPRCSLTIGMRHLASMYRFYDDWFLALAAYNCGKSRVDSGKIPKSSIQYSMWILSKATTLM